MTDIPVDGVFIAIGHLPQTQLFKGQIEMKPSGYIMTAPYSTATNMPGVSPRATWPTTSIARR